MKQRFKVIFLCLFLALGLTGCLGTKEAQVATVKFFDESGKVVTELSGAAVERDFLYTNQHIQRDKQYVSAFKDSGVTVKMGMVEINGAPAYVPTEYSIRGTPHFQQNLETRPPDHRGWASFDNIVNKATIFGLGRLVNDYGKASLAGAQTKYYGDYNPQTAKPYIVEPMVIE